MTYPLLDHCNRRNAAELARDLDARPLMSEGWAPSSDEIYTAHSERRLGRGDKVRCGEAIDGDIADSGSQRGRAYKRESWNVCRPFDETCHEHVRNMRPLLSDLADFSLKEFAKSTTHHTPPNHGHGAACGCGGKFSVKSARLIGREQFEVIHLNGESEIFATADFSGGFAISESKEGVEVQIPPRISCPHCSGTGSLICDDERAGRVSPSHAAGGYAEWQRRQLRITAVDWDAGIARFGPYVESK